MREIKLLSELENAHLSLSQALSKIRTVIEELGVEWIRDWFIECRLTTQGSLDFFDKFKNLLGEIKLIIVDGRGPGAFAILAGTRSGMILSAINAGYIGTGPRGFYKLLEAIGVKNADIAFKYQIVVLKKEENEWKLLLAVEPPHI